MIHRRDYIKVLGASIAPVLVDDWETVINESLNQDPVLDDFLVPEDALDARFVNTTTIPDMDQPLESEEDHDVDTTRETRVTRPPWDDERRFEYSLASREYSLQETTEHGEDFSRSELYTFAAKPTSTSDRKTPTPEELHRFTVYDYTEGNPRPDIFTGWVDHEIVDRHDRDGRWTEVWTKIPMLYAESELGDEIVGEKPCFETVAVAVTTDWGVLGIDHSVAYADQGQQTVKTGRQLVETLRKRADQLPTPRSEAERRV
jgi:hypothetical protein